MEYSQAADKNIHAVKSFNMHMAVQTPQIYILVSEKQQ